MATTAPVDFDVQYLRDQVMTTYDRVAREPHGSYHFHRGPTYAATFLGYDPDELTALPRIATERFAGVGNPLAIRAVWPGETVLDHACGAGIDLLLAARRVGPTGRAIGVDMTPAMVERAQAAAEAAGKGLGSALVADALARAARSEIAAFARTVDAKDEVALRFYIHIGFITLPDSPTTLSLPLETVRR